MKKKIGRFLKIFAFCALLAVAVAGVSRLVERKESREKMQPFLSRAGEYDVLFLGDSIMNTGVFPMEIWEKYGIAGYNIASYGNTLPITYWALQNALDYAAPKLVVLDVQGVSKSYKVSGNSSDVHTAFDCYPITKTKIRTMNDLMDDPDAVDDSGTAYADMKWEYLFTLGKYHTRWSKLTDADFHPVYNREKGAKSVMAVADTQDYDLIVTGDLGKIGRQIVLDFFQRDGVKLENYDDCGCLIFDLPGQDVHAGGSGCGCSASVLCSYLMELFQQKKLRRLLFCGTGALLSPTSTNQGESIPGVCHAVSIVTERR